MSDEQLENAKKVLIVDDDEFLLEMYALKFKQSGFTVEIAENGKKALELIPSFVPDVVLLDVVMPSMDGFEVLRTIKKDHLASDAVVIMLTNLGQKDDTERGMSLGADDYVVKAHFTPSEVVEKVKKVIQKKK